LSREYTYDAVAGGFTGVDISAARTYDFTISDPNNSATYGTLDVYANVISLDPSPLGGTYPGG
jgi:hypothetical protein